MVSTERHLVSMLTRQIDVDVVRVVEQKLKDWLQSHERELQTYFTPQGYTSRRNVWVDILTQVRNVPQPGTLVDEVGGGVHRLTEQDVEGRIIPYRKRWQEDFVAPLKEWAVSKARERREQLAQIRQAFPALKNPVVVTVRHITSSAFNRNGNEYTVVLVQGDSSEPETEQPPQTPASSERNPSL